MASFQQKPGQGSLFINTKKVQDNHPDYTGSIALPDGTECWLSCWQKHDGTGKGPIFSLSMKPKDARTAPAQAPQRVTPPQRPTTSAPQPAPAADDSIDRVPF